jgi:hypothetical protein
MSRHVTHRMTERARRMAALPGFEPLPPAASDFIAKVDDAAFAKMPASERWRYCRQRDQRPFRENNK